MDTRLSLYFNGSIDFEEVEDALVTEPVCHRIINAVDAAPLSVKGPCSVWAMAVTPLEIKQQTQPKRSLISVERIDGVIRCLRIMASETQEYKEREIARRDRQRPPKPTNAFKRISKRLSDLVS